MTLKFCANLSFMFLDKSQSQLERYAWAAKAGFRGVECAFPYLDPLSNVVKALNEAKLQQILINTPIGDETDTAFGTAAIPGKEEQFKEGLNLAIEYAKALKCERIHIMSGLVNNPTDKNFATYQENLTYATSLLAQHDIVGLIEPINSITIPGYFMNSYDRALDLIKLIDSPNLRLMLDVFHLQHIQGKLTHSIGKFLPYIGHIQVAQVPDRHEPNSNGEINYRYLFSLLEKHGYDKWIGLEYRPANDTVLGLKWIEEFGYKL